MAFLNNAGDIIIDAVLTDVGRQKLASGQPIVSTFALGDNEIDYGLYDKTNVSGSAYYDINILQTPILEPSSFSQAAMGSMLFSYPNNTLQYLPVMKLNQSDKLRNSLTKIDQTNTKAINVLASDAIVSSIGSSVVASDTTIIDGRISFSSFIASSTTSTATAAQQSALTSRFIRISQGFDNANATIPLGNLEETNFSIYVNRLFLKLVDKNYQYNKQPAIISSVFSRTQATDIYNLSVLSDPTYFGNVETYQVNNQLSLATSLATNFLQAVGKELQFSLQISDFLATNPSYYFTTYGSSGSGHIGSSDAVAYSVITTKVRIVSNNYGFSVDIPIKIFYA